MGLVNNDSSDVKSLIEALSDGAAYKDAQKKLVNIGEPAVEPLIEALQSDNEDVLWWAARSLGSIGDVRAVEPLIQLYKNPPRARIQTAAGLSLGKLGDSHAIPTLVKQLMVSNWINEVKSMLVAFGSDAVEQIIAFIKEKDDKGELSGVANAIEVLGMIGDSRAEKILEEHTTSNKYPDNIKRVALEALSKLGHKFGVSQEEIEKLLAMLLSNDYDIRKTALEQARSVSTSIEDPEFHRALKASENIKLAYDNQRQTPVNAKPIQACLDAIELEPQFLAAYICLSYLYRSYTTEKDRAIDWIEKAIAIDPINKDTWIEKGMAHVALGDVPKAVHAFHHVVSMEPLQKNLEPHCRLVAVYRKLNMQDHLAIVLSAISSRGVGLDPRLEKEWEQMVNRTNNILLLKAIEGDL